MRGPVSLAVLLVGLLLLAGCNGFGAGGSARGGHGTPTVTPAEVPESSADGFVAPGLTETELIDGGELLGAHRAVAEDRVVVVRVESRTTRGGERVGSGWSGTIRFGPDRERWLGQSRRLVDGDSRREATWYNGTASLSRIVYDDADDPRYRVHREIETPSYELYLRQLESTLAVADRLSTERLEGGDGPTRYRVRAHLDGTSDDTSVGFVAVVDERGFVHRYERTTARTRDGGEISEWTFSVEFEPTNATDLDRPDWLDEARVAITDREYVAPGVTTERVVDGRELAHVHRNLLSTVGVVVRDTETRTAANGTRLAVRNRTVRVTQDRRRFLETTVYSGTRPGVDRVQRWSHGRGGYVRTVGPNGTSYRERRPDHVPELDRPSFAALAEARTTTVTALDGGRFRVVAEGDVTGRAVVSRPDARNVTRVAVVTEEGWIERFELSYDVPVGDGVVHVRRRYAHLRRGDVTVDRPDWVEAATGTNVTGGIA
jgi:hypothetical protein